MADLNPADVPMKPWAAALFKERLQSQGKLDPITRCHSSDLHVIERFRRPDVGHLEIDATIDDPKAYSKPITYTQRQALIPDEDQS